MLDWQITAATFRCQEIDDEVTLLVYKDWSVKCTGYQKRNNLLQKENYKHGCSGEDCHLVTEYRDRLKAEESLK